MSFVSCTAPWSDSEPVTLKDPTVEQMEAFDKEHGIDTHAKPRGTTMDSGSTVNVPAPAPAPTPAPVPVTVPAPAPAPLPGDGLSPSTVQQLKN